MNASEIHQIARTAIENARANADRDVRDYGIEAMVKQEMAAAGLVWLGTLDGSERSIRAVSKSLKRDAKAGRIKWKRPEKWLYRRHF